MAGLEAWEYIDTGEFLNDAIPKTPAGAYVTCVLLSPSSCLKVGTIPPKLKASHFLVWYVGQGRMDAHEFPGKFFFMKIFSLAQIWENSPTQ